jgi:membrane-bound metal-dependent hydrolase YbcI (DUF457 family)
MDILTHAAIGLIAAGPLLVNSPELAIGIVAGSVLPDLDAFSRLWDKWAFLRLHQTWSHAFPVQLVFSLAVGLAAAGIGWNEVALGGGVLAGLLFHSLLDLCNTFGVAFLLPFSHRRFCLEWVFFIDLVVLLALAVTLTFVVPAWFRKGEVPPIYSISLFVFLSAYILGKGWFRKRAGSLFPDAKSLVPSALVPWRFFGTERQTDEIRLFRVSVITGAQFPVALVQVFDKSFEDLLQNLPEFRVMRELSSEYHVVGASSEGQGTLLLCRDMRMRNFGTRFGDLEVWLSPNRQIIKTRFHA